MALHAGAPAKVKIKVWGQECSTGSSPVPADRQLSSKEGRLHSGVGARELRNSPHPGPFQISPRRIERRWDK